MKKKKKLTEGNNTGRACRPPQIFSSPQACSFARPPFARLFDLRLEKERKRLSSPYTYIRAKHCEPSGVIEPL